MIDIGETIRILREQRGWTQPQLAEKAGISRECIWRYERGITVPMVTSMEYLLEAMGYELVVRKKQ